LAIARALRAGGDDEAARATLSDALQDVESQRQRIAAPSLRMTYFGGLQPFYEEYIRSTLTCCCNCTAGIRRRAATQRRSRQANSRGRESC
jgi:hypothetical protein